MVWQERVYLDYAATTPVDERVIKAILPYFSPNFGNPSSVHFEGQQAEAALEEARERIAQALGAKPREIIFTSGGTESDNLAVRGLALAERKRRGATRILITPVEHHAVSATAHQLEDVYGFKVEYIPVDSHGQVDPDDLRALINADTALVSVIYANNEIGTINPIAEIAKICCEKNVPFHTDAVQAVAHLSLDVESLGVTALSLGAHKFYGPKGVGALYLRRGTSIVPTQTGGAQENGLRAGTENIPLIVGMAEALSLVLEDLDRESERLRTLRDRLIEGVLESIPRARLTGHPTQRLPNHASFAFEHVDANLLLMHLDHEGFACSSGSACKTGNPEPSEVLQAIGLTPQWAMGGLRVTLGRGTSQDHIERFLEVLPQVVEKCRVINRVS
ncbi:cysteine desulfurase family protein [Thermanaerothrix sp. 4228-RoL]|uniref:Cysteine desulfurase family protein n=1 Tax=Thermanaerothrix solaris TaxID=3058434 RepID=A0ABU3NJS2_9CHLR|nr:cysteine desulfurase family protein [Thermanaerothrix sp. 4228-RoL]MDT8897106.1 cysteine desulfurase family protein [Thermanaerothrix sp. 4228-RoL]